jgi:alpha-mannosidase
MTAETPVYTFLRNHFDLVWRRCWQQSYEYEGRIFQSYSHIQRLVLDRMLRMAEGKGAVVELEQGLSLRDYLARRPGARARLRQLGESGRFQMLACGEAILDANQCSLETLARNLASGQTLARRALGLEPEVAGRFDSFGSSAQLPQIHRQCGLRWVTGFSYAVPTGSYWRGLDGSVVCVIPDSFEGTHQFLDHCYHEPCRSCCGRGCEACESTGIALEANTYPGRSISLNGHKPPFLVYWVQSEEMLPDPAYPEELASQLDPGYSPRWGGLHAIASHFRDRIENSNPPESEIDPQVEFNPVQTGTYVTRMRVKSAARRAERFFFTAEAACVLATLGTRRRPVGPLRRAWLELPLLFFHDSITGTHNDPAQGELLDAAQTVHRRAEQALALSGIRPSPKVRSFHLAKAERHEAVMEDSSVCSVVLNSGDREPVLPVVDEFLMQSPRLQALASGSRCREPIPRRFSLPCTGQVELSSNAVEAENLPSSGEAANPFLRVVYDETGLVELIDVRSGQSLSGGKRGRPNSLILEVDEGDPWGTRGKDRRRVPMDSPENSFFLSARRIGPVTEIVHGGVFEPNKRFGREQEPSVFGLEWTKTTRLHDASPLVTFSTEIYWKASNRRIRAVFPGEAGDDSATYGIPGGFLRRERYEQKENFLWSPDGDWPALDFFCRVDRHPSAALFNKGAVGSRVEDGAMMISLLRSPAFGHCLERYAQDYPMPYAGIRDSGHHVLEYALCACGGPDDVPRVANLAQAWNETPVLVPETLTLPKITTSPECLQVLALKPAFQGARAVLRVLNNSGNPVEGLLTVEGCVLEPCNLLERPEPGASSLGVFRPFELRSYLVKKI